MVDLLEIRRNVFHVLYGIGIVMVLYYDVLRVSHLVYILIAGFILSVFASMYRIPVVAWFLEHFERKGALPGWGAMTFLLGSIIALLLFERRIAYAGIMVLTFGDSFSHVFANMFGKHEHPFNAKKLVEGTVIGVILGFFGAVVFVPPAAAFLGSLVAMMLEAVEIQMRYFILDDNIFIPTVASLVIFLVGLI